MIIFIAVTGLLILRRLHSFATAAGAAAAVEIYGTRRALVFYRPPFRKSDLLPDQTAASAVECLYGMAASDFSRVRFQASVSQNPAVRCGVVVVAGWEPKGLSVATFNTGSGVLLCIKDWTVGRFGIPSTKGRRVSRPNHPPAPIASF